MALTGVDAGAEESEHAPVPSTTVVSNRARQRYLNSVGIVGMKKEVRWLAAEVGRRLRTNSCESSGLALPASVPFRNGAGCLRCMHIVVPCTESIGLPS